MFVIRMMFCCVFVLPLPCAFACTIFMAEGGEVVLAGNNEDYYLDVKTRMWVASGKGDEHGRICFGFKRRVFSRFAQGGMNDAGLFFDAAVTPRGPEPSGKGKKDAPSNMGDRMLAECGSVDEAVAWLEKRDLKLLRGSHLLLADSSGAAAVVELVDGTMEVFWKKERHLEVTNFSLANPAAGNYPCMRFALVNEVLGGDQIPSVDLFTKILQATAAPRTKLENEDRYGGTRYSSICDLTNGVIFVFPEGPYGTPVRVDVAEYLSKGNRAYALTELE